MEIVRAVRRFVLAGVCIPYFTASAQMAEFQPGARVRIRARGEVVGRLTGIVVSRTPDTLTITRQNAPPMAVAIAKLTTLEISRGKGRGAGALKGIAWGAGVGLVLGAVGPISGENCSGSPRRCEPATRSEFMGAMMLGSVIWGAGIGAIVGSERWDAAVLPTRAALLPPTRTQSPGIMLGWAFGPQRPRD